VGAGLLWPGVVLVIAGLELWVVLSKGEKDIHCLSGHLFLLSSSN